MLRFGFVILLVLLVISAAHSQDYNSMLLKYGVFGEFGYEYNVADFYQLHDIPTCCQKYSGGDGSGFTVGGIFEYPVTEKLGLNLRAGFSKFTGNFRRIETTTIIANNTDTTGEFEHTLSGYFSKITIDPLLYYYIIPNLKLNFGLSFGLKTSSKFNQKEAIVSTYGSFTDVQGNGLGRTRNVHNNEDIPLAASFNFFGLLGVSYDLPLNKYNTLTISPGIFYYYEFNSMVTDVQWNINSIRGGITIKYAPSGIINKIEDIEKTDTVYNLVPKLIVSYSKGKIVNYSELKEEGNVRTTINYYKRTDTIFTQKQYALEGSLVVTGVDSMGNETGSAKFKIEEFISNNMQPLLPYVFFDDNSSIIPTRYILLNNEQANKFELKQLAKLGTLETYYNILNIIGRRMLENPTAKLTITGCNSNIGSETNNSTLSSDRAENIKQYLQNVWGLDEKRLILVNRNLPELASTPLNESDKIEENRRVEFSSGNYEILSPIYLSDTIRSVNPPVARFKLNVKSEAGLDKWSLSASQKKASQSNFEKQGDSLLPDKIDWDLNANQKLVPSIDKTINASLELSDNQGQSKKFETGLPVDYISVRHKRKERIADKEIDRYNLILFDFDKYDIKASNKKIVEFIKENLKPESVVRITGYTDRTGEAKYNKTLSANRADAVKDALNFPDTEAGGKGNSTLLYDNLLPEGRFYCRTVEILVETPVQ